ncbi:MAG: phospho-sugar mutase [Bacteroidales bacterium OttesenSCG-928-I14]|jgi:phosphoglucomutase|nr:phospho-sugar mutase [Bacteroidales bacterium OttesenSCG-928-I14]
MYSLKNINIVRNKASMWLSSEYDENTRKVVRMLLEKEDPTELVDAFFKNLEFGTGGIRAIMGVGTNRMNVYTVGLITQGLANYLKNKFAYLLKISVVIGYDSRNNSKLFADQSAEIFSANGIHVHIFSSLRPTPEISYAIRYLDCQSGICITASHNSKEYNGYKIYWNDGAQVIGPHDKNILEEINRITSIKDIKYSNKECSLIKILDNKIDEKYIKDLLSILVSPEAVNQHKNIKIVYTPIHGAGITLIPKALALLGFENIIYVAEQNVINGDFPTVKSPNPEEPSALLLAIEKAKISNADLVMASDPDADRMGAAVRDEKGEFVILNGNQILLIFIYYLIIQWEKHGKLTGNEYVVKTIVSTETIRILADAHNVQLYDVYTGFKWIAEVMRLNEGKKTFIGGGEESYGFLAEDFVRDKDAVSACMLFAEIAAWTKNNKKTIYELLQEIYIKYSYSKEICVSVTKKNGFGEQIISSMMKNYRNNPPIKLADSMVILIKDFLQLIEIHITNNGKNFKKLSMPTTSNILQYFTEDGTKVSIRPSGTEPKIKFYIEVRSRINSHKEMRIAEAVADVKIKSILKSLNL